MCDGVRIIPKNEATQIFLAGITLGLISVFKIDDRPKYVWGVDAAGDAYEAKIDSDGYHGYRLEDDDNMRSLVLKEWKKRCLAAN
jgi:hypothetical protein